VSSSIQTERLDIFLPVLLVFAGHRLYILDSRISRHQNGFNVLKRTVRAITTGHLFLDQYTLFLDDSPRISLVYF